MLVVSSSILFAILILSVFASKVTEDGEDHGEHHEEEEERRRHDQHRKRQLNRCLKAAKALAQKLHKQKEELRKLGHELVLAKKILASKIHLIKYLERKVKKYNEDKKLVKELREEVAKLQKEIERQRKLVKSLRLKHISEAKNIEKISKKIENLKRESNENRKSEESGNERNFYNLKKQGRKAHNADGQWDNKQHKNNLHLGLNLDVNNDHSDNRGSKKENNGEEGSEETKRDSAKEIKRQNYLLSKKFEDLRKLHDSAEKEVEKNDKLFKEINNRLRKCKDEHHNHHHKH